MAVFRRQVSAATCTFAEHDSPGSQSPLNNYELINLSTTIFADEQSPQTQLSSLL
jgi:hypothetical protein